MKRLVVVVLVLALTLGAAAPAAAALEPGDRGAAVRSVQLRLGLPADGVYGKATARAVRRFQRRHGLRVTGRVDAATRRKLRTRKPASSTSTGGATTDALPAPNEALADAVRLAVGRPYATGAAGPRSFDCSGLVVWAAARSGLELPRSSFAQYRAGSPVARADLAPGDLVFFDTNGPGASDVGVVVGPDLAVSATTRGVRQHTIFGDYWGEHYVGARRFR